MRLPAGVRSIAGWAIGVGAVVYVAAWWPVFAAAEWLDRGGRR